MKKKTTTFFALLFAVTMMFSFGIATTASAGPECCELQPGCPTSPIGHVVNYPDYTACELDFTTPCDVIGQVCR